MKYKVNIEGGFTGLLREYEGEINLGPKDEVALLEAMKSVPTERNQRLRDGLLYQIRLEDGDIVYHGDFYGPNLPNSVRDFMGKIKA